MKEVYLIYASIPSILFDSKLHDYVKDNTKYSLKNGNYTGLYAWTTKKSLLNEFLEFRENAKSMYTIITREFTKEEYYAFKSENEYEKLAYYRFYHNMEYCKSESIEKYSTSILCTKEEYEEVYDQGEYHLLDYMTQIVNTEYITFKDEFKLALDRIGYCDMFNRIIDGVDEDEFNEFYHDRHEMSEFNHSYNLSYYGNNLFDVCENKLAIFLNIYYEMIVGFDPNSEIKLLIYR